MNTGSSRQWQKVSIHCLGLETVFSLSRSCFLFLRAAVSWSQSWRLLFTTRCTIVQSKVLQSHVVCLSVTLVDHEHIGWKSWKLIPWIISPTSSLFVAQRSSTYSQGNMEKFWGENVHSSPMSITSSWIQFYQESCDCRWRFGCWLFVYFCNLCDCTAFLFTVGLDFALTVLVPSLLPDMYPNLVLYLSFHCANSCLCRGGTALHYKPHSYVSEID